MRLDKKKTTLLQILTSKKNHFNSNFTCRRN